MNIVADAEGTAGCVLIRALEPLAGLELMQERRRAARTHRALASGPAKLTQALDISLSHYGADLTRGELIVREPAHPRKFRIDVTPRIGISKCEDLPLRFTIRGSEFLSA